ncbi:MAG: hypothetical protein JNG84_00555 [Archangium sp.]|nr:hypothetical protein [Archangium sp.]
MTGVTPEAVRALLAGNADGGRDLEAFVLAALKRDEAVAWRACQGDADAGPELLVEALFNKVMKVRLELNAADAERTIERYCAEAEAFQNSAVFSEPTRTRDAAVFMSGRADWEQGHHGLAFGQLHLPEPLGQKVANAWRTLSPRDYAGLDFMWMRQLGEFDFWSLYGSGPMRDLDESNSNYLTWQVPNFVTLQRWAKLRLIKGVHEGDLAQASREVRHLGQLCASTGNLIGVMYRSSMYDLEAAAWELAKLPRPNDVPSAAERDAFRALTFAGPNYLLPGVSDSVRERALRCMPVRCTALIDAVGLTSSIRHIIDVREHLDRLQHAGPCDAATFSRVSKTQPFSPRQMSLIALQMESIDQWLARLPTRGAPSGK